MPCGEHADFGSVTLLLQDHVGGLEVKTVDGAFVPAPPLEDAVLVNVGLILEHWTDGRLRATRHRIVAPNLREERMSLAFFAIPDVEEEVTPLRELKGKEAEGEERDEAEEEEEPVTTREFCLRLLSEIV